jgi:hypothetical protein
MNRITFKQYLDSKDQLRKAIEKTPIAVVEYEIKNYCTLTVGETDDNKASIDLKPKNRIFVEWRYDDIENPTPLSIRTVGPTQLTESHSTFWSSTKLKKWLCRHTKNGSVYNTQ